MVGRSDYVRLLRGDAVVGSSVAGTAFETGKKTFIPSRLLSRTTVVVGRRHWPLIPTRYAAAAQRHISDAVSYSFGGGLDPVLL